MRSIIARPAALAMFGALFLFACDPAQRIAVEDGIERAQQAKDAEARVLKASLCAMSIGAYHRINGAAERRALDVLCAGTGDAPDRSEADLKP
jgi:hypothetical protein